MFEFLANAIVWLAVAAAFGYLGTRLVPTLGLDPVRARAVPIALALVFLAGGALPGSPRLGLHADILGTRIMSPALAPGSVTGPCAVVPALPASGSLDTITDTTTNADVLEGGTISTGDAFVAKGWAVLADHSGPVQKICAYVDDMPLAADISYGTPRPDVAASFNVPADANTGFTISVPANTLPAGTYAFKVGAIEADGHATLVGSRTLTIR
jgi:hypothetical protein